MNHDKFNPPAHLSERAQSIWRDIVPRNARSAGRLTMLQAALEALDTMDKARAELGDEKLTTKTLGSGTVHAHPLFTVLQKARDQYTRMWAALGLTHYGEDEYRYQAWVEMEAKAAAKAAQEQTT